ncbi:hypothetical protein GCM10027445_18440 [Amycolatopsis endophytica]|uniref:NAD(P)-dependent oxidoreductase n=1 Tax=Amycolatopsis endophytica TaxID=860233 RepID=UPI001FE7BECD|nr:NAD(P)H-binding protein [Amycolatopsis endophytica]
MSAIVVFGAGGRAGRQAVAEAARRGHEVTAAVRDPSRHAAPDGVRSVAGDVTDPASAAALAKGRDAVVSAAAVYGAGTDPHAFFTASSRALTDAGYAWSSSGWRRWHVTHPGSGWWTRPGSRRSPGRSAWRTKRGWTCCGRAARTGCT